MARAHNEPLNVFLNSRLVGQLRREISGAISFQYDPAWLEWQFVLPVSLSLPLREMEASTARSRDAPMVLLVRRIPPAKSARCAMHGAKRSIIGRLRTACPILSCSSIAAAERETARGDRHGTASSPSTHSARDAMRKSEPAAVPPAPASDTRRLEGLLGESRPVDVLIRTGGEQRLSDFLLWESADAELSSPPHVARLHAARPRTRRRGAPPVASAARRAPPVPAGHDDHGPR